MENFHEIDDQDTSLAAAIHMSARFTYVSPAGKIEKKNGDDWGHVVDGGYFENSSTSTLIEILDKVSKNIKSERLEGLIEPVVIVIRNEPVDSNEEISVSRMAMEISSPIRALLNTRGARAEYSIEAIKRAMCQFDETHLDCKEETSGGESTGSKHSSNYYEFNLKKTRIPIPLGWHLSRAVTDEINRQISQSQYAQNFQNVKNIKAFFHSN